MLVTLDDVPTTLGCLSCLSSSLALRSGEILDILTREDERRWSMDILHSHAPCHCRLLDIRGAKDKQAIGSTMVLQLLHQSDLCLLLYGLVGRTILTHTEGIMRPYELYG